MVAVNNTFSLTVATRSASELIICPMSRLFRRKRHSTPLWQNTIDARSRVALRHLASAVGLTPRPPDLCHIRKGKDGADRPKWSRLPLNEHLEQGGGVGVKKRFALGQGGDVEFHWGAPAVIDGERLRHAILAGVRLVLNEVGAARCDEFDPHLLRRLTGRVEIDHARVHADVEAAVAIIARVRIGDKRDRGEAGVVGLAEVVTDKNLEVEVWNSVTMVVDHMDDELLPTGAAAAVRNAFLIHFVQGGPTEVKSGSFPGIVVDSIGEMEKANDEVTDIGIRIGDDGAVILAVHRDHRCTEASSGPIADGAARRIAVSVFESRVLAEVERNLAGVQGAASPANGAIGAWRIRNRRYARIPDIADEDSNIRSIRSRSVKRWVDEHVLVGQAPGVAAAKFEAEKNFITSIEEVGAEIAVAFDKRAKPTAALFRLR